MQPTSEWESLDFALYEAHHIWKAEVSQTTGQPLWLTRSTDPNVGWAVEESVDYADVALDEWDKAHQGDAKRPGVSRYAVPVAMPGYEHLLEGGVAREHHVKAANEAAAGAPQDDESAGLDIERKMPPGGWVASEYGG